MKAYFTKMTIERAVSKMLFFEIKKQFFGGIHLELSAFSRILMSHF
jgi:hypothetical protein